jgi:hypothetical protein
MRAPASLARAVLLLAMFIVFSAQDDGCGDDPEPSPTQAPTQAGSAPTPTRSVADLICEGARTQGDADSDCVPDVRDKAPGQNDFTFDEDGDGVAIALDRFQGNDFGDEDGDGWANWIDRAPNNPETTTTQVPPASESQDQVAEAERQRLIAEADRLANENLKLQFLNDQLDREAKNSDTDDIPDLYDSQPYLDYSDDEDNDDTPNGRDQFPLNPGYD